MKRLAAGLALTLALCSAAFANPALTGTWSAAVNGEPLVVTFAADGSGKVNGKPMQWQALGGMLFMQAQGGQAVGYSFEVKDGKLRVAGGDLPGMVEFRKGSAAAQAAAKAKPQEARAGAKAGGGQELAGKWCNLAQFNANRGGSSRMECFELRPDGSYTYAYEGSMSASTGSVASQSSDSGRWSYDGSRLTAQSRSGRTSSYRLEKRNHPKNKSDPMICLDGTCYVSYYNKPAW